MTIRSLTVQAFTILFGLSGMAQAQTEGTTPAINLSPEKWRPVNYLDLQFPGPASESYAGLWADRITKNNAAYARLGDKRFVVGNAPATESHIVVRSPSKTALVSVLNTATDCTVMASDKLGLATLKRCPMRVATYNAQGASTNISEAGSGCFIEYAPPPPNLSLDPSRNLAVASYDIASKTIRLAVIFAKQPIDDCQINVPVPQKK